MFKVSHLIKNSLLLGGALGLFSASNIEAKETTAEKVKSKGEELGNDATKAGRDAKAEIRDATGNHSTKEDIKDGAKNLGDDVKHGAKKAKRIAD